MVHRAPDLIGRAIGLSQLASRNPVTSAGWLRVKGSAASPGSIARTKRSKSGAPQTRRARERDSSAALAWGNTRVLCGSSR